MLHPWLFRKMAESLPAVGRRGPPGGLGQVAGRRGPAGGGVVAPALRVPPCPSHPFPCAALLDPARRGHRRLHRHAARPAGVARAMAGGAHRDLGLSAHRGAGRRRRGWRNRSCRSTAPRWRGSSCRSRPSRMRRWRPSGRSIWCSTICTIRSGRCAATCCWRARSRSLSGSPIIKRGHAIPFLLEPLQALAIYETDLVPELDFSGDAAGAGPGTPAVARIARPAHRGASRQRESREELAGRALCGDHPAPAGAGRRSGRGHRRGRCRRSRGVGARSAGSARLGRTCRWWNWRRRWRNARRFWATTRASRIWPRRWGCRWWRCSARRMRTAGRRAGAAG